MQRTNRFDMVDLDTPQQEALPPELRQVVSDLFDTWAVIR